MWRHKDTYTVPIPHTYCSIIGSDIKPIFAADVIAAPLNRVHTDRVISKHNSSSFKVILNQTRMLSSLEEEARYGLKPHHKWSGMRDAKPGMTSADIKHGGT